MAFRFVLNRSGVRQILSGPEVQADLERRANNVARAAGEGHVVDSGVGPNRARSSVRTDSFDAQRREAHDRNLTRAIDAARHG